MSGERPRIGVTASDASAAGPYLEALERFGASPELLLADAADVTQRLAGYDGLLVSGGADVEARRYGGDPGARGQERSEPARDAFEAAAIRFARDAALPAFLICRGLQIGNVAFGGTLVPDLESVPGAPYAKHDYRRSDSYRHDVTLLAGTIASIVGETRIATNSRHHQALLHVAPDLRVVGMSDDGVVEAAEATFAHPFFLGVQWHPENLALDGDVYAERLFTAFVAAAAAHRTTRTESSTCA